MTFGLCVLAFFLGAALTYLLLRHDREALLEVTERRIGDSLKALSADALHQNNERFLGLATVAVSPVRDTLDKVERQIRELEQARVSAYSRLSEQVRALVETQTALRSETSQLAQALRAPTVRGRWGELQLRRVVELAGMVEHCDFYEQVSLGDGEALKRPDMIVRLPGNRHVVVDAKAPYDAFLAASQAKSEDERQQKLRDHARLLRGHVTSLSRKSYWEQIQPAPDMVVLFLAGEHLYSAALAEDPTLIESAAEGRVIIATPTTLIAMLRAIAFGWRQEAIAQNARQLTDLGRELHKRVSDLASAFDGLGKHLGKSVESYNRAVHQLESRVLVTARKFDALGAASEEVSTPAPLEAQPRTLTAPELT